MSTNASGLEIEEYIRSATEWGLDEIQQRQAQLARHAVQAWNL